MVCDVLDWRCVLVSELAGTAFLASLLFITFYFIIAAKSNWGFTATVGFLFPIVLIMSLAISGFSAVMAFATIFIGFMASWIFNRLVGNR